MYQKGLKDVVAVHTHIASVDGEKGELRYRGLRVEELVPRMSFEQLASFLWTGKETDEVGNSINNYRELPEHVKHVIDSLPKTVSLMDAMRTAVSAFAHEEFKKKSIEEQAVVFTAALPLVIARHFR